MAGLKVLMVANEATGVYKLGGLGDVAASLPKALKALEVDIRLALPLHPEIETDSLALTRIDQFTASYDRSILNFAIYSSYLPQTSVPIYFVSEPTFISAHTDASDNHADKYAVFSLGLAHFLSERGQAWKPQVIHLNDWHSALVPFILKHKCENDNFRTLFSIHNLAYQASTDTPIVTKLGIGIDKCRIAAWDREDRDSNLMLLGVTHVQKVSTVSPTYAQEILTPEFGFGLQDVIKSMGEVSGILNGLDDSFNPNTDKALYQSYDSDSVVAGKLKNKTALFDELNIGFSGQKLVIFIGRIDSRQKGIDLIEGLLRNFFNQRQVQFIFLGTGEPETEKRLHQLAGGKSKIITRFDELLARRLYAAGDLILIPSHYEPCGLIQMIAMKYGTIPVAHATGGLKDSITSKTGFLYSPNHLPKLEETLNLALERMKDPEECLRLIQNAMRVDFSWRRSAPEYLQLYERLCLA